MRPDLTGKTALVIDDDADSVQFLRAALEPFGVRLMTARSAEEAKSLLGTVTPDVIIADLLLPGENGLAFVQWLRSRKGVAGANVPAIAVTSFYEEFGREQAEAAGFTLFFPKPVDPMELVSAVALLTRH